VFAELNDVFIEDEVESIENNYESSNDETITDEVNDSDNSLSNDNEEFHEIMQFLNRVQVMHSLVGQNSGISYK